eukprot:TRINITY_DN32046_c0_g1_i1.p1 TRINITY_DN32046_c0_g1~~TRINITY_DN32046_c0_g1_i1.p1  ORF type:complete len:124 (-),score=29.15 TRINITY_DN32046_c0_g1_i1:931-1278(-)
MGMEEENTILPTLETTTTTTRKPYSPRKSAASSLRSKFRPKRPQKENDEVRTQKEEKELLIAGKDVPETNRISVSFKDRFKLKELPIKRMILTNSCQQIINLVNEQLPILRVMRF